MSASRSNRPVQDSEAGRLERRLGDIATEVVVAAEESTGRDACEPSSGG